MPGIFDTGIGNDLGNPFLSSTLSKLFEIFKILFCCESRVESRTSEDPKSCVAPAETLFISANTGGRWLRGVRIYIYTRDEILPNESQVIYMPVCEISRIS